MSYDLTKVTNLGHLKALAQKVQAITSGIDSRVSTIENAGYVTETTVDNKISAAVAGSLQPAGSIAFASLPQAIKANLNKIYNITDAFTTTSDFVEGAGKSYPAGTNVAIINVGSSSSPSYKYDTYTGVIDMSPYAEKVSGAVSGNFAGLDANGNLVDSGKKPSDFLTTHQDISGKADKVASATSGDFAALDVNGNLTDSGKKASDFASASHTHSDKADKVSSATAGNFAGLDANGNLTDSGSNAADFAAAGHTHADKADKPSTATSGNLAKFDANKNPVDSGIAAANVMTIVASATPGHFVNLNAGGQVTDAGYGLATDAEVTEMINEVWA